MHQIFEWRCTRFWRGEDTGSDQDKGAIAPLGRRPPTSRTICDTFSARIEERKGKLTATLASRFLNLHDWFTSNLHINSSSTCCHKQNGCILERVGHNTHSAWENTIHASGEVDMQSIISVQYAYSGLWGLFFVF